MRAAQIDVSDEAAVAAGVAAIVEEFGRLDQAIATALRAPDIMAKVHNGGMRVTYLGPTHRYPTNSFCNAISCNHIGNGIFS